MAVGNDSNLEIEQGNRETREEETEQALKKAVPKALRLCTVPDQGLSN